MTREVLREVEELFRSDAASAHFAVDATIASQSRILMSNLRSKFDALFAQTARNAAPAMVNAESSASTAALNSSLATMSGGMSLRTSIETPALSNVIKASVAENVRLIKSIAGEYLHKVEGAVMRSITTGRGLQDLVPQIQEIGGQTERRSRNIALDQTRKVYNNINKGRMQALGVEEFEWIHSGGGAHPREDHVEMDGQIFRFDNPPVIDKRTGERGIPAQAPNCKCTMRPVFRFDRTDDDATDSR